MVIILTPSTENDPPMNMPSSDPDIEQLTAEVPYIPWFIPYLSVFMCVFHVFSM